MRDPPVSVQATTGADRTRHGSPTDATFPVSLRLEGRRVLVVGAGPIAAGKIDRLKPTQARITVVAPEAVPGIATDTDVVWHRRPYRRGEVASYRLAIACTGDPAVDAQVYRDGEAAGIWVNAADDVDNCSFFLPAVARAGTVTVAVGTGGASPALASFMRRRAQVDLDDGVEPLVELVAEIRTELREATGTSEHPAWAPTLDRGGPNETSLLDLVRNHGSDRARIVLRHALGLAPDEREPAGVPLDREGQT